MWFKKNSRLNVREIKIQARTEVREQIMKELLEKFPNRKTLKMEEIRQVVLYEHE